MVVMDAAAREIEAEEFDDAARSAWVPVQACTLPTAEQPLRVAEFDSLFAGSLQRIERPERSELLLTIDATAADRARDLAARESDCCSFFTFAFESDVDGSVTMRVGVPSERTAVLDGLAAQAAAARSDTDSGRQS